MGKFFRRLLVGAAVVWGIKSLQDKRREWSSRPADEIRRNVISKLPDSMDAESKEKVADKVIQAVKGDAVPRQGWTPSAPPTGTTTPPPETPLGTTTEPSTPSTPPKVEDVRPSGSTTPVPPVEESEKRESSLSSPPISEEEGRS